MRALLLVALAIGVGYAQPACYQIDLDLQGSNINNGLSNLVSSAALCQQSCKVTAGCSFWTWLGDDYEGSTGFKHSCWLKDSSSTTPVYTKGAVSGPRDCENIPDIPDSPSACCGSIKLDGGSMSDLYQNARMGNYRLTHTDANGRPVYDQINGDNYLFWLAPSGPWMVGETVGTDYGGLLNRGTETCPESLTTYWDYWHTMFESWETDEWLEAVCDGGDSGGGGDGGSGGDGEVYECVTGPQCLDCNTQASMDGTLYCCSVDCDYAWIETWSENGNYYCQCGLDKK